jgi:hypothetical protein
MKHREAAQQNAGAAPKRIRRRLGIRIALMALVQAVGFCIPNVKAQSGCYLSSVVSPAPLLGNHGEVVRLADGSLWEVIGEYLYLYQYYPSVVACPSKLIVGDHRLNVRLLHPADPVTTANSGQPAPRGQQSLRPPTPQPEVIDSQIYGEFTGWDGETIFRLMNGQIWQQTSYSYTYHYAFMPKVLIFRADGGYIMQVDGIQERISVRLLR